MSKLDKCIVEASLYETLTLNSN